MKQKKLLSLLLAVAMAFSLTAVSYTHLDGAERQRGQHPGDAAALLAAAGEIEETQEIGPKQYFQMFP